MDENNWKLMSVTRGGVVSLVKDLTKTEAEFIRRRLLGLPATVEEAIKERERWYQLHPPGPDYDNSGHNVTKEQWAEWHKNNQGAHGCRWPNCSTSWAIGRIDQDSDIQKVEIFQ